MQINQVTDKFTGDKKANEETIKKAEFNSMLDLKTLIAKSATEAELNRVPDALREGTGQEYSTRTISTDILEIVKHVGANIQ